MTKDKPKLKRWIKQSLQGITYWIGHRRCLYRGYPLSEGALVAELCNLIYANIDSESLLLKCEVQYSHLHRLKSTKKLPDALNGKRADIVIAEKPLSKDRKIVPKYIIEVKREVAGNTKINDDLRRLAEARCIWPESQTFLFVISEANRPSRFVDEEGKSILCKKPIPKSGGYFKVRRTWKAAHAFTKRDHAQYACLIEVYPPT